MFAKVYLVTNADKYKHYERWATASDFPTDNIINDGSTSDADSLGSVADLALCLRAKKLVETDQAEYAERQEGAGEGCETLADPSGQRRGQNALHRQGGSISSQEVLVIAGDMIFQVRSADYCERKS